MSGGLLGKGLRQGGRKILTLQAQRIHIWDIGTPDVKAAIDEQRVPDNGSGVQSARRRLWTGAHKTVPFICAERVNTHVVEEVGGA